MHEKVLIIEGDEKDSKDIARALNKMGYDDITVAETGEEGLSKTKSFEPDVIILDVHLPDTKGFKVCKEIRNIIGLKPQIVMISSVEEAGDVVGARIVGADDFSAKTDDYDGLIQSIKRLSSNR